MKEEYLLFTIVSMKKSVSESTANQIGKTELQKATKKCKQECLIREACRASLVLKIENGLRPNIKRGKVIIRGNNTGDNNCGLVNKFAILEQFDV